MKWIAPIALAAAVGFAVNAEASNRAVFCDECTSSQMAAHATSVVDDGTVFVFNKTEGTVGKYLITTEYVDTIPFTIIKDAMPLTVDPGLKNAWETYSDEAANIPGEIDLPDWFPVRSVAGALQQPAFTASEINDWIASSPIQEFKLSFEPLVAAWLSANIPWADFSSALDAVVVTFRFSDGSEITFEVTRVQQGGNDRIILRKFGDGDPRDPNGEPIPQSPLGLRNFTYDRPGNHEATREWIEWLRSRGATVNENSDNPSWITCARGRGATVCQTGGDDG